MKIRIVDDIPENPGEVWKTKVDGYDTLALRLPCGDLFLADKRWNITDIDTDHPTITPSIFCEHRRTSGQGSFHGWLTNGELA